MIIKGINSLGLGMALFLFVLGCLNIGEIIVLKAKYITCLIIAILILMLAALVFEVTEKIHQVFWLKVLYRTMWILLGSAAAVLLFLPLIIVFKNWLAYDCELMVINLGLVLLMFFLKEAIRSWKVSPAKPKLTKPKPKSSPDNYFAELPRVMRRKKSIDIFYE